MLTKNVLWCLRDDLIARDSFIPDDLALSLLSQIVGDSSEVFPALPEKTQNTRKPAALKTLSYSIIFVHLQLAMPSDLSVIYRFSHS